MLIKYGYIEATLTKEYAISCERRKELYGIVTLRSKRKNTVFPLCPPSRFCENYFFFFLNLDTLHLLEDVSRKEVWHRVKIFQ